MTRPKLVVINSDQSETTRSSREGKKYRFELSRKRLVLYVSTVIVAFCWMFILGVLVGRGVALVSSEDFSMKAEVARFLGLGKGAGQPSLKAAETWGDPRKMLESLNYYEDLTQRSGAQITPNQKVAEPSPSPTVTEPVKEAAVGGKRATASSQPASEMPAPVEPEKAKNIHPNIPSEQYTLLVASLKDPENAQKLVDQLTSRGYHPRIEALDLNGGGRWNRVLVGTFSSRENAIKFAADFNRKESMEGLVIRDSN